MKRLLSIIAFVAVCANSFGQGSVQYLKSNDPDRIAAMNALRQWIDVWNHPDEAVLLTTLFEPISSAARINSNTYLHGPWFDAVFDEHGNLVRFTKLMDREAPTTLESFSFQQATDLVERLLDRLANPIWTPRIRSSYTRGIPGYREHIFWVSSELTGRPGVAGALDYQHRVTIDAKTGIVKSFDVQKQDTPLRGTYQAAYTPETLRTRAVQAHLSWRPFSEGSFDQSGMVFREPDFQNFAHWMTPRHLAAAAEKRQLAMYQLNLSHRSPLHGGLIQRIVWVDALTGDVIAIRDLDFGPSIGSGEKPKPAPAVDSKSKIVAARKDGKSLAVLIETSPKTWTKGTLDVNTRRFSPEAKGAKTANLTSEQTAKAVRLAQSAKPLQPPVANKKSKPVKIS